MPDWWTVATVSDRPDTIISCPRGERRYAASNRAATVTRSSNFDPAAAVAAACGKGCRRDRKGGARRGRPRRLGLPLLRPGGDPRTVPQPSTARNRQAELSFCPSGSNEPRARVLGRRGKQCLSPVMPGLASCDRPPNVQRRRPLTRPRHLRFIFNLQMIPLSPNGIEFCIIDDPIAASRGGAAADSATPEVLFCVLQSPPADTLRNRIMEVVSGARNSGSYEGWPPIRQ